MRVVLDTSALVKRYVREAGSDGVVAILQKADRLAVSILYPVEAVSAFSRLRREGKITRAQYADLKTVIFHDLQDADIVGITPAVVRHAIRVLEGASVKALDALHIACALEWRADLFVTADRQQEKSAADEGLRTAFV